MNLFTNPIQLSVYESLCIWSLQGYLNTATWTSRVTEHLMQGVNRVWLKWPRKQSKSWRKMTKGSSSWLKVSYLTWNPTNHCAFNGWCILLPGARIDHGHHENTASRALEEVLSMEEAVKTAMKHVNLDETLIIVTADHSHPLSIASYARRGNPILGKAPPSACLLFWLIWFMPWLVSILLYRFDRLQWWHQ